MRKGEATRQRILAQAAPLFNQKGFEGCSMHDLMQATGLEKGGLYRHFANKEELAAESLRFALRQTISLHTEHLAQVPGAVARLRRTVQIFVEAPSTIPGGCPLMNTAIDADDGNPELRRIALQGLRTWRSRLAAIVQAGIRSGELRPATSPRQVANTLIATLEGALMISRLERTRQPLLDAQSTLNHLLQSIARHPSSTVPARRAESTPRRAVQS